MRVTPILHYWNTPNGHKPVILLEELGAPFSLHPVDIGRGEQFSPAYTEICPNQKIPALTVADEHGQPFHLFESGAILTYLADRHGAFLPAEGPPRYRALQHDPWVAGEYSIADMAIYPWVVEHRLQQQNLADTPRLARWFSRMQERPAVQRAYDHAVRLFGQSRAHFDARAHEVLFSTGSEPKAS